MRRSSTRIHQQSPAFYRISTTVGVNHVHRVLLYTPQTVNSQITDAVRRGSAQVIRPGRRFVDDPDSERDGSVLRLIRPQTPVLSPVNN